MVFFFSGQGGHTKHYVGLNKASLIISKAEVVKGYYYEKIKTSSSRV